MMAVYDQGDITEKARDIKVTYQEDLLSRANVVGLGIGLRQKRGKPTEEIALVVFVNQKLPRSALASTDVITTPPCPECKNGHLLPYSERLEEKGKEVFVLPFAKWSCSKCNYSPSVSD